MARVDNELDDDWVEGDDDAEPTGVDDHDGLSPIEGLFADELDDVDDLIDPESLDDERE